MEYQTVCRFKFNNEFFQLLLDDYNRYFFLKINGNGKYKYVTIEEYLCLSSIFLKNPKVLNAIKNRVNIKPKIVACGATLILGAGLLSGCSNSILHNIDVFETHDSYIESSLSFDVADNPVPLKEDTHSISSTYGIIHINDSEHLSIVYDDNIPTKQELIEAVNKNDNISDDFKKLLLDYIDKVTSKHPSIDYRIFLENLKNLRVHEVSKDELTGITMNTDSVACYDIPNDIISVLKGNVYEEGSPQYQELFHEISHSLRTRWFEHNGYKVKIQSWGTNLNIALIDEILNSLFTVSLYDDDVLSNGNKKILYQLQSNYFIILLDSLDNYSIEDYVNYSASHLAIAMDKAHGDTNYGSVILALINAQFEDYHNNDIEIAQEEYYPIYDYLSDLYFAKYIHDGMSYEEAKAVCDKMVSIITYNVPKGYNIDVNRFYQNLDEYCEQIGISPYAR